MHSMSQARMQRKIWEIRPRSAHSKSLAGQLKITPLFAQILLNRQISDPKTARSFLSPKLKLKFKPNLEVKKLRLSKTSP